MVPAQSRGVTLARTAPLGVPASRATDLAAGELLTWLPLVDYRECPRRATESIIGILELEFKDPNDCTCKEKEQKEVNKINADHYESPRIARIIGCVAEPVGTAVPAVSEPETDT